MSDQNQSNQNSNSAITVGVAWEKDSKNKPGTKFFSIAPLGKKENDEYEMILRRKSDGNELPLFETAILMFPSIKREGDNERKPTHILKIFIKD